MFTSFPPNELKVSEKRKRPGSISSDFCKHPHPDDGNCCNSKLPYPPSPLRNFDGRCPKNTILESEESALSSLDEQSLSKQGSHPHGICDNSPLSCYRSSPSCFDGRCPKNMTLESAESAELSSDVQSLSKQNPVGGFRDLASWYADYPRAPGLVPKHFVLKHAEFALSSFNEQSLSKQGSEYELIDALNSIGTYRQSIYHCNFIARLKNEGEAEDMLFFAELKYERVGVLCCLLCCILGPSGIKTGEYGCRRCLRYPGLIQHPEDGFSNVYPREDIDDDAVRLILSREADHGSGLCNFGKVNKSQSRGEIKFLWQESASALSIQPPPFPPPCTLDGRCPKDIILKSAESAESSSDVQSLSKQNPVGGFRDLASRYGDYPRAPGLVPKHFVLKHAEFALSSFNEQSLCKQGPEYELIDALNSIGTYRQSIYHCNFIARLKNEGEAEDMLFFAELKYERVGVLCCLLCCILGPSGIKTGEYGCRRCLRYPGLIQHPEDGFSNVYPPGDIDDDAVRLILSREADHGSGLCNFGKVNKSQSRGEIKFLWQESASALSIQPPPFPPPCTLDGRCPKDIILKSAESAESSSDVQSLSKQNPVGGFRDLASRCGDYPRAPGLVPKHFVLKHAEFALSSFNEQSLCKQGSEYELIDALNSIGTYRQSIYHCNFIARLKNEGEAEDMLFFAELKYERVGVLCCLLCCILGPSGIKTGEYGCRRCLRYPGLIQHPEDGFSNVYPPGDI